MRTSLPSLLVVVTLFAATGAASCSLGLEPRPDRTRYYTLAANPGAGEAGAGAATGAGPSPGRPPLASLGLGPVTLPRYLDRPHLVTRLSPERLAVSADDRWAAPLEELFWRVLAEDLRRLVSTGEVVPYPWSRSAPPALGVSVEVLRFEAEAGGAAVLEARWSVGGGGGGPPLASGATRVREPAQEGDTAASVAALGRAVEALARDVSAAVQRLATH